MSRKKILLLNPPAQKKFIRDNYCSFTSTAGYVWPPIDLLVLSGIFSEQYTVHVMDAICENLSPTACLERMRSEIYHAIVFLTGTASWKNDCAFMRECKNVTGARIIGSGGNLLSKGEAFMRRFDYIDAITLDYTDKTIVDYLEGRYEHLENLMYRDKGQIKTAQKTQSTSFSYPVPQHRLFPLKKYDTPIAQDGLLSCMIISFGCPFSCQFCMGSILPYRKREITNIKEELLCLQKNGIKEIFFCDSTFTADRDHAQKVCALMIDEKLSFRWSCNIHVRTVDKELLTIMKRAGCHTVLIGVESGNEELLNHYEKPITKQMIEEVFLWCREIGLRIGAYFIIGLPGETRDAARQTINFAIQLKPDFASFSIATPDVGTSLWHEAVEKGWYDESIDEFNGMGYPVMNFSGITQQEIWQLRQEAYRKFYFRPQYIYAQCTKVRSLRQLLNSIKYGIKIGLNQLLCNNG